MHLGLGLGLFFHCIILGSDELPFRFLMAWDWHFRYFDMVGILIFRFMSLNFNFCSIYFIIFFYYMILFILVLLGCMRLICDFVCHAYFWFIFHIWWLFNWCIDFFYEVMRMEGYRKSNEEHVKRRCKHIGRGWYISTHLMRRVAWQEGIRL